MRRYLNRWDAEYKRHGGIWRGESALDIGKYMGKGRVLEAGCGNGKGVLPLVRAGYDVTGLDVSKSAVDSIRGLGANLVHGDICDFSSRRKFDAVVCRYVLGALKQEDRLLAVKNITSLLKKGGFVFFEDFAVWDMRFGKGEEIEANTFRRGNGILCHYFGLEEAKGLFKGLAALELAGSGFRRRYGGVEYERRLVSGVFRKSRAIQEEAGAFRKD